MPVDPEIAAVLQLLAGNQPMHEMSPADRVTCAVFAEVLHA